MKRLRKSAQRGTHREVLTCPPYLSLYYINYIIIYYMVEESYQVKIIPERLKILLSEIHIY